MALLLYYLLHTNTNSQIVVSKASSKSASDERLTLFNVYFEDEPLNNKFKLHIKLEINL